MRFNRWLFPEAINDVDRLRKNHPQDADLILALAEWIVAQLAEDAHLKGEQMELPDGTTYRRWAVGPLVVIFRVLQLEDRTAVIEGFSPAS